MRRGHGRLARWHDDAGFAWLWSSLLIGALSILALALPTAASAAIDVKTFSVTPSDWQAGAHPDLRISMTFCTKTYAGPPALYCTDDEVAQQLKTIAVKLPPGVIASPRAAERCSVTTFRTMSNASGCPSGSQIGTMSVGALALYLSGHQLISVPGGTIFNLTPTGSELGRMGFFLDPGYGADPVRIETEVVMTSDHRMTTLPSDQAFPTDLYFNGSPALFGVKVHSLTLTLKGSVNGAPLIQNPTSCTASETMLTTTVTSSSPGAATSTKNSAFTPTGCGGLIFDPQLNVSAGSAGQTARGSTPPVAIAVDVPSDQSAIDSTSIRLPDGIRPSIAALNSHSCAPELALVSACPANSRIGYVYATTPLSDTPLSGPLYLIKEPGQLQMQLLTKLSGPTDVDLWGTATFDGNSSVANFTNLPDVPTSDYVITLNGGADGVFTALTDLCGTNLAAAATFVGKNGKVSGRSIPINIAGCGGASVKIDSSTVDVNSSWAPVVVRCLPSGGTCRGSLSINGKTSNKRKKHKKSKKHRSRKSRAAARRSKKRRSLRRITALGESSMTIAAGSKKTVAVKLTNAAKRTLKRKGRLKVTVRAQLSGGGGVSQAVTLKLDRPKKKSKKSKKSARKRH